MVKIYQLNQEIELLEDLHSGSGMGDMLVDAYQMRDSQGRPFISRQHYWGVLKDAIIEYLKNIDGITDYNLRWQKQLLNAWVSPFEDKLLQFVPGAGYFDDSCGQTAQDAFIVWGSSARVNGDDFNRAAKVDSLRTDEYVKAGARFKVTHHLYLQPEHLDAKGIKDKDLLATVKQMFQRVASLGAKRSRGAGKIKLNQAEPVLLYDSNQRTQVAQKSIADKASNRPANSWRLTLLAEEPLKLPDDQLAGNVIGCQSFVSANRARGAIANMARLADFSAIFHALINGEICVSDALPIAQEYLDSHQVIPLPKNIHFSKPSVEYRANIPWWVEASELQKIVPDWPGDNEGVERPKLKRGTDDMYLLLPQQADEDVLLYQQPFAVQMRNKVAESDDEKALFSERCIPEGQYFHCNVTVHDAHLAEQMQAFLKVVSQNTIPLLIGRGKSPCVITAVEEADSTRALLPSSDDCQLVVTLCSPLLSFCNETLAPDLTFDWPRLRQLLQQQGIDDDALPELSALNGVGYSESTTLTGFNFAANLPRKPELAVAAGSTIKLTAAADQLKQLAEALEQVNALGERQQDGLGRFGYYFGELQPKWLNNSSASRQADSPKVDNQEHDLLAIESFLELQQKELKASHLSRSQYQKLQIEIARSPVSDLDLILDRLAGKKSQEEKWLSAIKLFLAGYAQQPHRAKKVAGLLFTRIVLTTMNCWQSPADTANKEVDGAL